MHKLLDNLVKVDGLQAQLVTQLPPMIEIMKSMRAMMLTMHSTMSGMIDHHG